MKQKDRLVYIYSELKMVFLTVILLFFVIFPFFLPARFSVPNNLFFAISVLILWLASAIIFLLSHLYKKKVSFRLVRFLSVFTDVLFLSIILYILSKINSDFFFIYAFIIIGAAFYLDTKLILFAGITSVLAISIGYFFEINTPLEFIDLVVLLLRIFFLVATTYFVYLFVLSFKEIIVQKIMMHRLASLNKKMLLYYSNQLRAPLPVLRDFISCLMEEKAGKINPEQKHILNLLYQNTSNIIEDSSSIIYYNQLKEHKLYLNKTKVNLINLIHGVLERVETEAKLRRLTFEFSPSMKSYAILVDKNKISSAIYSVIRNIVLMSNDDTKIKISLFHPEYSNIVFIDIKYHGKPLSDPEKLIHSQIDLYVAEKILNYHGGRIWLTSKEDNIQEVRLGIALKSS